MSTDRFQLDIQREKPRLDYVRGLRAAAAVGKSPFSLLREIASLYFGQGKLQPEEYFTYKLYDDSRFAPGAKQTFMGAAAAVPDSVWAEIGNDKPTMTAFLRGLGLPTPETQGMVHETRSFGGAHELRTREDVRQFLREDADYPVFGKPFDSGCSLGTANITSFDHASDSLVLCNGQTIEVDSFIDQIEELGWKYLFQTLMRPHSSLVPLVGEGISTVRMFVLVDQEGCHLLRASWKIPGESNGADNFWRAGNVLAGIDVETGRIVRTLFRNEDGGIDPISKHPTTNADFENLVFPEWDSMRDVVLRAAPNLPGSYFQGWDVALTDRGPVLVELEGAGGDPIMEQLCFDSGLLQGRVLRFLATAPEIARERAAKGKARRSSILQRNLAQLSGRSTSTKQDEVQTDGEALDKVLPGHDELAAGKSGQADSDSVESRENDELVSV